VSTRHRANPRLSSPLHSRDQQSLTILIPLCSPEHFEGGGTAFWSDADAGRSSNAKKESSKRTTIPTALLTPPEGTAILFTGRVLHSGIAVSKGERSVLVASFSPAATRAELDLEAVRVNTTNWTKCQ